MFLEPIEPYHIIEVVNKLNPKMSFGHDGFSTKILKESIHTILLPITHIINKSIETGIVPKQMKCAKVIPIFKASEPSKLENYRPISLLPAFSKILEKVMYNKLMSYLNSQQIFYKHQYGFRPKHATIHPLIHLLNKCAEAENSNPKKLTLTVLCDLSKAFDVINHNILMKKLEFYGIRGIAKEWIRNYLSDRTQYVEFDNHSSKLCSIDCGVPQGSILGPLLYLIYVNDIAHATDAKLFSFADDTSLCVSDSNSSTLFQTANTELNKLYEWFCANRLSLNANKTKYIVLRSPYIKCPPEDLKVVINGIPISRIGKNLKEDSCKFLGISIDEHLTWKHHLSQMNNKLSKALFTMKQVQKFLPTNSLKTLYFAMIHPLITYGILAWGNASSTILNKSIKLQKRAIRLIYKVGFNAHTEPLFKRANILKLQDQIEYEKLLFMYDFVEGNLPLSFNNLYAYNHENQADRLTRQSNQIRITRCNSDFARKLPLYNFPHIWNSWSGKFDQITSRSNLKRQIKDRLLTAYEPRVKCSNPQCTECVK
jgi:hypothetical protein